MFEIITLKNRFSILFLSLREGSPLGHTRERRRAKRSGGKETGDSASRFRSPFCARLRLAASPLEFAHAARACAPTWACWQVISTWALYILWPVTTVRVLIVFQADATVHFVDNLIWAGDETIAVIWILVVTISFAIAKPGSWKTFIRWKRDKIIYCNYLTKINVLKMLFFFLTALWYIFYVTVFSWSLFPMTN